MASSRCTSIRSQHRLATPPCTVDCTHQRGMGYQTVAASKEQAMATCPRKVYTFACKCRYLSPSCKCCPELPKPISPFTRLALPPVVDLRLINAKQSKFRSECPNCQLLKVQLKQEEAQEQYKDALELWGEHDEDASSRYKDHARATRNLDRLSKAILRDSPNMKGWERLD